MGENKLRMKSEGNTGKEITNKNIAFSLMWKMLERVCSQGINLLVQIILARILMPNDFATLAVIVSITNFAGVFVQAGLSTAIVQKRKLDELDISTVFFSSIIVAAIIYIILYVSAPALASYISSDNLVWPLRIQGLILFMYSVNSVQMSLLQREMRFKSIFVCSILAVGLSGFVGITIAYYGFGVWALVVQSILNVLITILTMKILGRIHINRGFSWDKAKEIYAFSGKILASSLLSSGYESLKTMSIGHTYAPDELAYYDKAYTYSYYVLQTVGVSLSNVLLPVFSRQQAQTDKLRNLARRSIKTVIFIMFPIMVLLAAISEPLVSVLLTEKWSGVVPYFVIFCFMRLPNCYNIIDKQIYFALGRSDVNLKYDVVDSLLNIIMLFITINIGPLAVALGVLIIEFLMAFILFRYSYLTYGYRIFDRIKDLSKPLINSLIMFAVVHIVIDTIFSNILKLIIGISIGMIVYVLLSAITKDENFMFFILVLKKQFLKRKG